MCKVLAELVCNSVAKLKLIISHLACLQPIHLRSISLPQLLLSETSSFEGKGPFIHVNILVMCVKGILLIHYLIWYYSTFHIHICFHLCGKQPIPDLLVSIRFGNDPHLPWREVRTELLVVLPSILRCLNFLATVRLRWSIVIFCALHRQREMESCVQSQRWIAIAVE